MSKSRKLGFLDYLATDDSFRELFTKLSPLAAARGFKHVVYGAMLDDRGDHRPGAQAAREYQVRAPLDEADLSKEEIRELSRRWGLTTWNKPSFACL